MGLRADSRTIRRALYGAVALAVALAPVVAPATVEEQRARLPPPAACSDPVEGVWQALRFNARYGVWNLDTLTVRRAAPGATTLVGEIGVESWTGDATRTSPPPCAPGVRHWIIDMAAEGTWDASTMRVDFRGLRWRVRQVFCEPWSGYMLDHFTGVIDRGLEEFQAVNNDGDGAQNDPAVFRRIDCSGAPRAPAPRRQLPPVERRPRGCSR